MILDRDACAAIAGARLQAEARIVGFVEKTRDDVLTQSGLIPYRHDAPRRISLPNGITATFTIEEVRLGIVCRHLILEQIRPRSQAETGDENLLFAIPAILKEYGYHRSITLLDVAGGVRHEQTHAIDRIAVYEPLNDDMDGLVTLRGYETDILPDNRVTAIEF